MSGLRRTPDHSDGPSRARTFVDVFCGAGGFTEGLLLAGDGVSAFKLIAASDISPMARLTFEGRFAEQLAIPHDFVLGDIRNKVLFEHLLQAIRDGLKGRGLDVLCGGPPCQGFSVFGQRNQADPRNELFRHYLNLIDVLRPKYFVIENVPGLVRMYGGRTVARIEEGVASLSTAYTLVGPLLVNAADYGVPQLRERVLFIGCRGDVPPIEAIPGTTPADRRVSVGEAIGDLAFLKPWESAPAYSGSHPASTTYQRESRRGRLFEKWGLERADATLRNHDAAKHAPDVVARFSLIDKGKGLDSIPQELWTSRLKTAKKWCVKLDDAKPSYTVMTLPDDLVHFSQPRILTVRESARLQSFDDTFCFLGPRATGGGGVGNRKRASEVPQYSQVGNAVPPLLARAVGNELLQGLEDADRGVRSGSGRVARQERFTFHATAVPVHSGISGGAESEPQ